MESMMVNSNSKVIGIGMGTMIDDEGGPPTLHNNRRKGMGVRTWVVISESGQSSIEEVGKHSIMRRTGLPARDLRALDPLLSYPSSILGRERAIVINLEHIKAIVTAKEVLMLNSTNPLVVHFVQDLQNRISSSLNGSRSQQDMSDIMDSTPKTSIDLTAPKPKLLPFEFRALEACLESACRCLDSETRTLEDEAYPALDELTSKISTLNLERVRQIKSRLVAISGRVQKVRDELEHLLDDDNDMAEMYLTEKITAHSVERSVREDVQNVAPEVDDERDEDCKSENNSENLNGFKLNVVELEMLLEAYFAQIDGILQKLSDMREYVDDTEDYINIMLDDTQNQLLLMGVMLSTANMILNMGIVVVGIFGMNIHISLFDGEPRQFWATTFGTVSCCIILYGISILWGKRRYLAI